MVSERKTRSRSSGHSDRLWTAGLVLLLVCALAMTGSVMPLPRAALHLGAATLLLAALRHPKLNQGGWVPRVAAAGLPLLAAVGGGLLSRAHNTLEVLSPGVAAARLHDRSWTLSLRPDRTVEELFGGFLLVAVAVLVAVWCAGSHRRARAETTLAWATVAWAAFGAAHAVSGAEAILGVVPVRPPDGRFWAPLVNPNHHGLVLAMGAPFVLAEFTRRRGTGDVRAWPFGAVLLWVVAFPFVSSSMGLLLTLGAQVAAFAWMRTPVGPARLQAVGAAGVLAAVGAMGVTWTQPEWWRLSAAPRLTQWLDAGPMIADHWLAGVGAGSYGAAYPAYRTVRTFASFDHVHADPLEWVVETGALGVVAVVGAALLAPWGRTTRRRRAWTLSLVAVIGHSTVDFPLQLPGLAMLAVSLWTVWAVGFRSARAIDARVVRGLLVGLALVQLVGAATMVRRHVAEGQAATAMAGGPEALVAADWLDGHAPWRREGALARITAERERGGTAEEAIAEASRRFADDGTMLRVLAALRHRDGALEEANALLARSFERDPQDFRTWRLKYRFLREAGLGLEAAEALAQALRRWPRTHLEKGEPLKEGYALLPMGEWWVEALHDAPAHWNVRLAWLLMEDGDPANALLACDAAARDRPEVFGSMPTRALALVALGRAEEGEAYALRLVRDDPTSKWGWYGLGQVFEELDRPEEAVTAYTRAVALDTAEPRFPRAAAVAGEAAGGEARRVEVLEDMLVRTGQPEVAVSLARAHLAAGRPEACRAALAGPGLDADPRWGKPARHLRRQCITP